MSGPVPIVLASRSPRRRQLLEEADWVLLLVQIILRSRFQKRVKVKSSFA